MADFTSTQSGDWNDGGTWGNTSPGVAGTDYPGVDGDTATIGHSVDYDCGDSTVDFGNVTITDGGTLTFPTDSDSTINFNTTGVLLVNSGGSLVAGTSTTPISSDYHCKMYWDHAGADRAAFKNDGGGSISLYGDPEYYGSRESADLDSDWTSGQTLYVSGDVTSDWGSGLSFYIHKNIDYSSWTTDAGIFTIDTVGTYDSANDRTPITISETAPAVSYYATHTTSGFQSKVVIVSRNIELADTNGSLAVGFSNTYTERLTFTDNCDYLDDTEVYINNVLFISWDRAINVGANTKIYNSVFVNCYQVLENCELVEVYDTYFISSPNGAAHTAFSKIKDCYFYSCSGCSYSGVGILFDNILVVGCNHIGSASNRFIIKDSILSCINDGTVNLAKDTKFINTSFLSVGGRYFTTPYSVLAMNCDFTDGNNMYYAYKTDGTAILEDCTIDGSDRFPLRIYNYRGNILPLQYGDTDWQTPDSGSDWILKAEPNSYCSSGYHKYIVLSPIENMADYVTSGPNTLTFNIYPYGWTTSLDQDDVVLEVSYLDSSSGISRTTVTNTSQTYANSDWRSVSVTFSPSQDGIVYFNLYIKKYEASCYVLIDPVWSVS